MSSTFTLLHPDGRAEVPASVEGDRVRIAADALRDALGWELKPQGLCRGDVCVPVRDRASLVSARGVDLAAFAEQIGVPLALDAEAGAAALGVAHRDRLSALDGALAPDFRLPDLAGRMHTLSEHRGKKALLIAYASW